MKTIDKYNEIVAEVQSKEDLDQLLPDNDNSDKLLQDYSSKSKVDPWRSIAWVVASILNAFEVLFALFKKETTVEARSNRIGTADWWLRTVYEFQFGDNVQLQAGKPYYPVIDENKQIITNASHQVQAGINLIKVVKSAFPDFEPLSNSEADALRSYLKRVAPPGIGWGVITDEAEQIKIVGSVFYDGTENQATVQAAVEAVIDNYIKYMPVEGDNNIFNGTFVRNELIDQVRDVDGVKDFSLTEVIITVNGIDKEPNRIYQPISGWMRIADGFPLDQTIEYYAADV